MRIVCVAILIALASGRTAMAHPHPGGIVVLPDGTVVVGDILGGRLLVIEAGGRLREIAGVGDVRGLALASDGALYGVSWQRGAGVWKLGADNRPTPVFANYEALLATGGQGSLFLAPIDAHGLGQHVEVRNPAGEQSVLTRLSDITALAWHQGTLYVAAGSTVHTIDADGTVKTLAAGVGTGLYGLAMGRHGLIATCYEKRQVVEIAPDGARRVLLTSDHPWSPTGVAVVGDTLYVAELAEHPCCFKGPRVRRVVAGEPATTLLTIDDGNHLHVFPGDRPFEWMVGVGAVTLIVVVVAVLKVRRRWQRAGIRTSELA